MPRNQYQVRPAVRRTRTAWHCILSIRYKVFLAAALFFFLSLITLGRLGTVFQLSLTFAASPLETAKSDYNFQFSKYKEAHERFISAKSNYLKFKTATSKDQAYAASKDNLNRAIDLYLAYFALVQEYGNSLKWQDSNAFSDVANTISDIKNTYLQAQQSANTSQTLEDIIKNASDLAAIQISTIDPKLYWILSVFELENAKSLIVDFDSLAKTLSENEGNFGSSSILTSWQTDVEAIRASAQTQLDKASLTLNATNRQAQEGTLKETILRTQTAKTELTKSKSLFLEAAKFSK